jgi:ribosomal protein L32
MIYKAGRKYIDLERVTAIRPITFDSAAMFLDEPGIPHVAYTSGAMLECQLHEHPIEVRFDWEKAGDRFPETQFDDLMQAWRSVVEKRNKPFDMESHLAENAASSLMVGGSKVCDRCQRMHAVGGACDYDDVMRAQAARQAKDIMNAAPPAKCPSCHTFHNSNETCPVMGTDAV